MKKMKLDETGDSDDLQALFDSIASETPQKVRLEVVPEAANSSGDSADLEALFDSVSDDYSAPVAAAPAAGSDDEHSCDNVFNKVGHLARQLHDTLRELGYDHALEDVANQMPDARSRLTYIAQMTESAASRVLNATDIAIPLQDDVEKRSSVLHDRWEKLFRNELSVEEFKAVSTESCTTPITKPTPTTCMATSLEIPNILHASGISSKEPPATPDAPQAAMVATRLSSRAVGTSAGISRVCTAASVSTVIVTAAPAILMVAPSGIDTE